MTHVDVRIKKRIEINDKRKKIIKNKIKIPLIKTGEEGVKQIKALLGLEEFITNVNLPNSGQIGNLPAFSVVESNALFNRNGIQPVISGNFSGKLLPHVLIHAENQSVILQAALNKCRKTALKALTNEPHAAISARNAGRMLDEMLNATIKYLPGWK